MRQDATVEVGAGARARQRGLMGWWLGGGVEEGGPGRMGRISFLVCVCVVCCSQLAREGVRWGGELAGDSSPTMTS